MSGNITYKSLADRFLKWRARFRRNSIRYREESQLLNEHIGEFMRLHSWFRELEPDAQAHWLKGLKRELYHRFGSQKKKERKRRERAQAKKNEQDKQLNLDLDL